MTELMELTDDEDAAVEAAMDDPSLIKTVAHGEEILEFLKSDIEDIHEQLQAAKLEAEICGSLPPNRQEWLRRATSAIIWKKRKKKDIEARIRELQPAPDPEIEALVVKVATPAERAEARIREMELMLQIQREKDAAKLQRIEISNKRVLEQAEMFVKTTYKALPPQTISDIWRQAREAFPDNPNWT